MNYYRFLDSRDIRNHLENMEYPLSTPEAAYLVWQCHNATLEEKFTAWEEIAKIMPDCPIPRRPGMTDDVPSVHQFLRDYMDLEKKRLEDFTQGENCVFGADFSLLSNQEWREEGVWSERDTLFPNYTSCFAYCRQEFSEEIGKVRICKQVLGRDSSHRDSLTLTAELEPLCLDVSPTCDLDDVFPSLWVDLPTPFRRGDILWDPSGEPGIPYEEDSTPFVLDYIPNWNEAEQEANGFVPGEKFYQRKGENGKYESRFKDPPRDYGAYGVTVVAGGQLHQAYDGFACYLDLETYDGPLEGTFAALKPISQYMKGNLPEDLFLNSVLTLLHPPQREPTLSISLTTAVRKPPAEP